MFFLSDLASIVRSFDQRSAVIGNSVVTEEYYDNNEGTQF